MSKGSSEDNRRKIQVRMVMASGETVIGSLFASLAGTLRETLNNPDKFMEVEKADGSSIFLAKDSVQSASVLANPKADQLKRRRADDINPYEELGLKPGATQAEIRTAYRNKVRSYHPDRLASVEVPREVAEYMSAMFIRVTTAYHELVDGKAELEPA
jgi:DnaJ domain